MGTGVQGFMHAAKLQERSARAAECRNSGISARVWCQGQGFVPKTYDNWERRILKAVASEYMLPAIDDLLPWTEDICRQFRVQIIDRLLLFNIHDFIFQF